MLFWGWGRKSLTTPLTHQQAMLTSYRYAHIFFVFTLSWGYRYALATQTVQGWATREITEDDARQLTPGGVLPRPSVWRQYSLLAVPVGIVVVLLVNLVTR